MFKENFESTLKLVATIIIVGLLVAIVLNTMSNPKAANSLLSKRTDSNASEAVQSATVYNTTIEHVENMTVNIQSQQEQPSKESNTETIMESTRSGLFDVVAAITAGIVMITIASLRFALNVMKLKKSNHVASSNDPYYYD